jgi:hypothetical protein
VEIALAVERTANVAPQDEQPASTTYSLGCWVKEVPPLNRTGVPYWGALTYMNDPAAPLFRKCKRTWQRLLYGLATAARSRLAAGPIVRWRR